MSSSGFGAYPSMTTELRMPEPWIGTDRARATLLTPGVL
jgi:hypothetical protein